jgi:hypothetical protein
VTSGAQLRGTLEQCSNGGQFELVLVNVAENVGSGAMTSRSRVQVSGEQVVGIEFARAIDVHRLMRTKEKRAMGSDATRQSEASARQPDTHESEADDESLCDHCCQRSCRTTIESCRGKRLISTCSHCNTN